MSTIESYAVKFQNVSKSYPLYPNIISQILGNIGIKSSSLNYKKAIDSLNLKIGHGEKVGLIGHNGSGKTTFLKLICGFTLPSSGQVLVDGSVQSLMQRGYGFNDSLSGLENIRNALIYNGLPENHLLAAEQDIIDFVELGDFIHHPIRTYSLGMRARLEYAAVTAISPDILVIDEVLGAGDGYFVSKCANRMRKLVKHTTLLLVSHSLDQIREYCDRVIWIDRGCLREDGPVDKVLANYSNHMSAKTSSLRVNSSLPAHASYPEEEHVSLLNKIDLVYERAIDDDSISAFSFSTGSSNCLSAETGDNLAFQLSINLQKPMSFVILGFTTAGGYAFEMTCVDLLPAGLSQFSIQTDKIEVGVGNYILIPAFFDVESRSPIAINRHHYLKLQMLEANWSEPPLVHFNGDWYSGSSMTSIASKVSPWV